jgi:hypothetical protein
MSNAAGPPPLMLMLMAQMADVFFFDLPLAAAQLELEFSYKKYLVVTGDVAPCHTFLTLLQTAAEHVQTDAVS